MGLWKAIIGVMVYLILLQAFSLIHGNNLTFNQWLGVIGMFIIGIIANEGGK